MRIASLLLLAVMIFGLINYLRPLPAATAQVLLSGTKPGSAVSLPWPAYGQTAYGVSGYGLLATHGETKPVPIASVSKIVTALAVLSKKPLASGATGPTITLTPADVDSYNQYVSQGGSVMVVQAGEQLNERQMLEAMLLPSADNIADSLAIWAFGSVDAYVSYANNFVKTLGLKDTHIADASGLSAGTVSTATDLVQLGFKALANPVVSAIVTERSATLPVSGTINNVNWLINSDGFFGIKTGNTDEAGGCFLFAVRKSIGSQNLTIVGAVLSAPNLYTSMLDSRTLADAVPSGFKQTTLVSAGGRVARYKTKWNTAINAVASKQLSALVWEGQPIKYQASMANLPPGAPASTSVGSLKITSGTKTYETNVVTKSANKKPPFWWRLTR